MSEELKKEEQEEQKEQQESQETANAPAASIRKLFLKNLFISLASYYCLTYLGEKNTFWFASRV